MQPNVVFIILNWNGKKFLEACLKSVLGQIYDNYNVVVVDNGSADGSVSFLRQNFPGVDILALETNTGYPGGNNAGIKYALENYAADYLLLLNNDTVIIEDNWLKGVAAAAEADPSAGLLGCRLIFPDGTLQQIGSRFTPYGFPGLKPSDANVDMSRPYEVDAVIGAVFLIKRAVVDKIGLLDEGFSPFSAEDMDYCARVRKAGYSIRVVPDFGVIHYASQAIKSLPPVSVRLAVKRGEIRFKLLNLSFFWLFKFMVFEIYNFIAHVFERRNKTMPISPANIRVRGNWPENTAIFAQAYLYNLKNLPEIIAKRSNRSKKLWY